MVLNLFRVRAPSISFLNLAGALVEKHCCTASGYLSGSQPGSFCAFLPVLGFSAKPKADRRRGITKEFCVPAKLPCAPGMWEVGKGGWSWLFGLSPPRQRSQVQCTWLWLTHAIATALPNLTPHAPPRNREVWGNLICPVCLCFQEEQVRLDWEALQDEYVLQL